MCRLRINEKSYERIPTGYKWRSVVIPKDDAIEAEIEEMLVDFKSGDDSIEWDIDYNGGVFGDDRVIFIYSNGDVYTELKYKISDMWNSYNYDLAESLKLKESGMYDYYDTPDNEYATFIGDTIPEEEPDKSYKHSLTVPEDRIEDFARFVASYFNEDFDDIVNNKSDNVWIDDFDSYGNRYITIVCSDEEYKEIERWLNKKSLRKKNEAYPRYKKSYWKYRLDHPFIDRIEDSETAIFTDNNIRNIPLLSCENPDDCYSDTPLYWAVEDADYNGNPLYCKEDEAYKRLKHYLNMKLYERRNDL